MAISWKFPHWEIIKTDLYTSQCTLYTSTLWKMRRSRKPGLLAWWPLLRGWARYIVHRIVSWAAAYQVSRSESLEPTGSGRLSVNHLIFFSSPPRPVQSHLRHEWLNRPNAAKTAAKENAGACGDENQIGWNSIGRPTDPPHARNKPLVKTVSKPIGRLVDYCG